MDRRKTPVKTKIWKSDMDNNNYQAQGKIKWHRYAKTSWHSSAIIKNKPQVHTQDEQHQL